MQENDAKQALWKKQGQRLEEARLKAGFARKADAIRHFRFKEPTYNKHESGERGLTRAAARYAKAYGVKETWLLCKDDDDSNISIRGIPVTGQAAVGVWLEDLGTAVPGRSIGVPERAGDDAEKRFAVHIVDESMNKLMPSNSYAVCLPVKEGTVNPQSLRVGMLLWIERTRRGLRERTLRRVSAIQGNSVRLSTFSKEAKLKQEVSFPSSDGEKVLVLGRVVGIYQDYTDGQAAPGRVS